MPIFNVFTRKFSQFVPQNVQQGVGLTDGANSIGPESGGGGATITYIFTQTTPVVPPLYLGAAVRVDEATELWQCTLATDALHAEFYAFIVAIVGNVYTVQFAGPVLSGSVPLITNLAPGTPYYLSDSIAGGISTVPPAVTGEVNLPVLWGMDNGNSVIKMSRGFIEGSGGGGGGGGGGTPNNISTITQNTNFNLGDALYLQSDQNFQRSNAYSTLQAAQAEWMVIDIVTPGSVYMIQQGGKVEGIVSVDDEGAAINSGPIYYISPTIGQEGKLTQNEPTAAGQFSKPFYVQQIASSNTGWLLDQRPLAGSAGPIPPGDVTTTILTSTYTTTTSGWETVFCATITPSALANGIWVKADVAAGAAGSGNPIYFRLIRNGTPIFVGDAAGARLQASGAVGHHFDGNPTNWFVDYIDYPGLITQVVYCVQIISPSGATSYVNRTTTDTNNNLFGRSTSSIVLIEVQP